MTKIILGVLILLVSGQVSASIVTIDFEGVPDITTRETADGFWVGPVYTEDGFNVRNLDSNLISAFISPKPADSARYTGTAALFADTADTASIELTAVGGGEFDLLSIDISELGLDRPGGISVMFVGTKANNSTVSQTFSSDVTFGMETFTLSPIFTALVSVKWEQGPYPNYHQFDNIVLSTSPVPVPAAIWLFGTALIGLVGFSKRRKAA